MTEVFRVKVLEPATEGAQYLFGRFSEPARLLRLQQALLMLLVVWMCHSIAQVVWSGWPSPDIEDAALPVINPSLARAAGARTLDVDLEAMLETGLFGDPVNEVNGVDTSPVAASGPLDGIESGARETRLDLKLSGIVASTEDGLGTAVIEARGKQANYAVGDALPASGNVTLAKVMPQQVVLDNNGTYELLTLFEKTALSDLVAESAAPIAAAEPASTSTDATETRESLRINTREAAALATQYREQLYENPQSLAQVVRVAAVRGDTGLRGYRVSPGSDVAQFKALGFQSGDLVTAVNGLTLSDPANTMRLYQMMRDATEATFDVERDGGAVSISVSLNQMQ